MQTTRRTQLQTKTRAQMHSPHAMRTPHVSAVCVCASPCRVWCARGGGCEVLCSCTGRATHGSVCGPLVRNRRGTTARSADTTWHDCRFCCDGAQEPVLEPGRPGLAPHAGGAHQALPRAGQAHAAPGMRQHSAPPDTRHETVPPDARHARHAAAAAACVPCPPHRVRSRHAEWGGGEGRVGPSTQRRRTRVVLVFRISQSRVISLLGAVVLRAVFALRG